MTDRGAQLKQFLLTTKMDAAELEGFVEAAIATASHFLPRTTRQTDTTYGEN